MDTKLKKMHKKTALIISLVILVPALLLTALYPRMESEYLKKIEKYQQMYEIQSNDTDDFLYVVAENFINYATEAIYFQYAMMLQETQSEEIATDVLEEYGWIDDYSYVDSETRYLICYNDEKRTDAATNSENDLSDLLEQPSAETLEKYSDEGYLAYFTVKFDSYGKVIDAKYEQFPGAEVDLYSSYENAYSAVKASIRQYEQNVESHNWNYDTNVEAKELLPKNVHAVFLLSEDSYFVWEQAQNYWFYDAESIYAENGVLYIIGILMIVVALAALLLPFFKKLETGWENIFSIPCEIAFILALCDMGMLVLMYEAMTESRMHMIEQMMGNDVAGFEILGVGMSPGFVYAIVLILNFIGWSICFAAEYVVVAHIRQFLSSPKYYLKNRLLLVLCFKWIGRKLRRLYVWVTDIDIAYELNKSIVKIVLANFAVLTLLCCMWVFGIAGLVLYSIALYVILRKYGETLQKQYQSVLNVTQEMAEGNLKIAMEEELGVFEPLGNELERVQEGFAKAVREEAKSQNMKTELITNVSHDLKTPLTAIITYVDLLKQENLTEEQRQSYIETLEQKSQRLKVLIEDLFEVSKANSGNVKMNFMDVDVVSLLKQVRLEMEDKIMDSNLTFRWNLPEEKIILSLDGQRTYRVFENLLNNILKYAMEGSRVYIDVTEQEQEVKIIFRNISAMELETHAEHLTDRFVRGDESRNSDGSGLGLAIVKSFVELQNGEFKVEVDGDLFKAIIIWQR